MKRNLFILYAVACLQGMVFYGPVATLYRQAQGVSVLQITLIESISLALCLLLELPWGILADKIGYRRTLVFCSLLYFISKVIFWQACGFGGFLAERILLSIVMAGLSGVDSSLLYLSCKPGESQRAFSIYSGVQVVGLLAASLIYSGFVGSTYKLAGFLTVISYGIAAVLALGLKEVKHPQKAYMTCSEFFAVLRQTFQNKRLLLLLVGAALFSESHQTITVFLSQLQYAKAGVGPAAMGLLYTALTLAGLCSFRSARVAQKIGGARLGLLCCGVAAVACASLCAASGAVVSALAILALRCAHSLFAPLQLELQNREITTPNRATALSINAVLMESIGVGTNLAFGALAQARLEWAFLLGAAFCLAGAVLFGMCHKKSLAAFV